MTIDNDLRSSRTSSRSSGPADILSNIMIKMKKPTWLLSPRRPNWSWRDLFTTKTLIGWPPEEMTRETAWLDGLRGVAAFLVMVYHFGLEFFYPMLYEAPYGSQNLVEGQPQGAAHYEIWRLPFFRLWMDSGHAQVSTFFVLSGFVLSWGPLGSIKSGQVEKFAQSLSSATFRRWIRLYFPCFAIALWEAFEVQFGWRIMPGKEPRSNIFILLWDYLKADEAFANPLAIQRSNWSALHEYDYTMWTIPFEFAGSLAVFVVLLAVARFRSFYKRTIVIGAITAYCCYKANWSFWLFTNGMLIANYVRHYGGFKKLSERSSWPAIMVWSVIFIIGLLMAGIPEHSEFFSRPGYDWMDKWVPRDWQWVEGGTRYWWCWAGILIVTSSCHLSLVRRFFEIGFMRHLGRISYMLYLTHRVVLNLFGQFWKRFVYSIMGREHWADDWDPNKIKDEADLPQPMHSIITFVTYFFLMAGLVPVCMIVAHWCEVLIDGPSTRFAKSVDEWFKGVGTEKPAVRGEDSGLLPSHRADVVFDADRQGGAAESLLPPRDFELDDHDPHNVLAAKDIEMTEIDPKPEPSRQSRDAGRGGGMV